MTPERHLAPVALLALAGSASAHPQITLPYDAPQVIATDRQQIVATLDLDGDGWMDAMGWWLDKKDVQNPDTGKMHGWLNDGTGRLVPAWEVQFVSEIDGTIPRETVAVLDLDADGDDDWALVAYDRIRVYLSNGSQPPTLAIDFAAGSPMRAIAVANFDAGDVSRELAVARTDGTLAVYEILLGAGTLQLVSTRAAGIPVVGPLVAAEFTGDSAADLLLSGARLFPCVGGVIQPFSADFGLAADPLTYMFAHDVGDLDGDGDIDAVTFSMNGAGDTRTRMLRRTGPGTLVAESVYGGGPARKLADIDGDGDLDGVCCGGGGGGGPTTQYNDDPSIYRVALNDGNGTFAPAIEWPGLGSVAIAGAVDLDKDGDLDLVAGRTVHYAQGGISSQPMPKTGDLGGRDPWLGDIDGDGDLDADLHLTGYLANTGDGTFVPRTLVVTPPIPGTTRFGDGYAGDWDGDGDIDLLAALAGWNNQAGMELLCNVAPGRFESAGVVDSTVVWGVNGSRRMTTVGDLDGDGDVDLVLIPYTVATNHIWLNDGAGGLTYVGEVPGGYVQNLADLNGDGLRDLVAAPAQGTRIHWAANLGNGAFGSYVEILGTSMNATTEALERDRFVTADLDGDGDIDLATFYELSWNMLLARVLWNDGNAVFTPEDLGPVVATMGTPSRKRGALALDIHGNGNLDLVFGPLRDEANAVAVLLRSIDGSGWVPARNQVMLEPFASAPILRMDLAAGDLDGDGDVELVSTRAIADMRFEGPAAGHRIQLGSGVPGLGGVVPLVGAEGPFRVGKTVRVRLAGLGPGASGVLTKIGATGPAAPIGGSYGRLSAASYEERIPFVASGTSGDPAGSGTWKHEFEVTPNLAGTTWRFEAIVNDSAAVGGTSRSNLLLLTYGN